MRTGAAESGTCCNSTSNNSAACIHLMTAYCCILFSTQACCIGRCREHLLMPAGMCPIAACLSRLRSNSSQTSYSPHKIATRTGHCLLWSCCPAPAQCAGQTPSWAWAPGMRQPQACWARARHRSGCCPRCLPGRGRAWRLPSTPASLRCRPPAGQSHMSRSRRVMHCAASCYATSAAHEGQSSSRRLCPGEVPHTS